MKAAIAGGNTDLSVLLTTDLVLSRATAIDREYLMRRRDADGDAAYPLVLALLPIECNSSPRPVW